MGKYVECDFRKEGLNCNPRRKILHGREAPLENCFTVHNACFCLHGYPVSHFIDTASHPFSLHPANMLIWELSAHKVILETKRTVPALVTVLVNHYELDFKC